MERAIRGVPSACHPARSAKIGGTPDMERPCGRIRARTACAALRPARDPPAPLFPAPASTRKSAPPLLARTSRAAPPPRSPASMCERPFPDRTCRVGRCAKGTSQIAHRKSVTVLRDSSYVRFGTSLLHIRRSRGCDLERPFCTWGGTRAQGKGPVGAPPRAPAGARNERAARQGRDTARRPSPGRGRRGAKGGLSPDSFGDVRKERPGSHAPRAI